MPDINEPTEAALELGEKLKVPNVEFDAWVASMPAKHWSKYDLSACRLGWEAALDAERQKREAAERERDEALALFDECAAARDVSGFLGTVPECIAHWTERAEAAEAEVSRLKAGAVTDGWQSIDTAPTRDENGVASRLLGFFNDRDGGRVDTIWRMDGTKPYWVSTTIELTRGVRYMRAHQPTYWRQLPAGPAFEAALSNQAETSK